MPEEKKLTKRKQAKNYIHAIGRRKTATARVRLYLKKGPIIINDQPIEKYFPGEVNKTHYFIPLKLTDTQDKFSATIKVKGSGKHAQLGAVVHGLSRALAIHDLKAYRPILKQNGLLTRDPRERERRKVGTGGKARRQKQSPKR